MELLNNFKKGNKWVRCGYKKATVLLWAYCCVREWRVWRLRGRSQEVIHPTHLLHEGQGESQAAGAKGTVALLWCLLPLLAPAVSSVCSPQALPHIHFPLCFSTFIFHFSVPHLCFSFPCFLSHSQCGRKAAQKSPLPPALEEKTGPRRQMLPLACWKQVGWFFHHRSKHQRLLATSVNQQKVC